MKMTKIEKRLVNSRRRAARRIEHIDQLLVYIDTSAVASVLEIGCGVGFASAFLNMEYKMKVTGIDVDPKQIELAKKYNQESDDLKFVEADAARLLFSDFEFDLIVSMNVLHHIGEWEIVLDEVNRILKPKGYYLFADLAYTPFFTKMLKPVAKNYGVYTIEDIVYRLHRNGFHIVHQDQPRGFFLKRHRIVFQKG